MNDERKPNDDDTPPDEEVITYERLREETRKLFAEIRGRVNVEAIRETIDKAASRLKPTQGHTAEAVAKAKAALKKDLARAAERLGPKWETFSEKGADLFGVWRDRGAVFLSEASRAVGSWLQKVGEKFEHRRYRAGDIAYQGTFRCEACGGLVTLMRAGRLSPCGECGEASFVRV